MRQHFFKLLKLTVRFVLGSWLEAYRLRKLRKSVGRSVKDDHDS